MRFTLRAVLAASTGFALFAAGCGSAGLSSNLRINSEQSGQLYAQTFTEGVADVRDAGDTDLVVTSQINPIKPGSVQPLKQVLHVQMLWQQGYAVRAVNRDVSRNASFHWYIYPAGSSDGVAGPQLIEYSGTGLVALSREGDQVSVKVADAHLTPARVVGDIKDPLGTMNLSGTLTAKTDRRLTAAMLGDIQATVAAAKTTANSSAEAKLPLGP